jgi:psiF repeat-containing protein
MNPIRSVLSALLLVTGAAAFAAEPPTAPSATPVKHPTLKSCNREATAKKLSGRDREQYVKDCLAHKPAADATRNP